ncbi:MAG: hypothetical protein IJG82_09430 [Atopobiaceae bacterium]|nr:hypothetical protein [Atopobiaceae bacterium]
MTERTAYLLGWLEGFSGSIWAMCSVQEHEVVAPEAVDEYEKKVKELRETLAKLPASDTGPFVVTTVPLAKQPVDMTPKITFTAEEGA